MLIIGAILAVIANIANRRKYGPSPIAVLKRDFLLLRIMQDERANAMRRSSIPARVLFPPGAVLAEKPTAKEVAPGEWECRYRFEYHPPAI